MFKTVLMIEKALSDADVELVTTLHGEEKVSFVVLMQPRGRQDELLRALDDVALGHLDKAVHEHDGEAADSPTLASESLAHSLRHLQRAGAEASGEVVQDSPLDRLREVVEQHRADEVLVLTSPHFVEEFFHRDWASQARHKVGVPVLKLFARDS
ncbi:indole-3-glycerol phosphate synthase [Kitasatospora sp. NPDC048540]|uniref:indole-3-glycerol phosphate synthase n=1 Tax=unclassified Kitasatospora TaxID=2633591 RepID=UPI000A572207|nr:indole-3-glycerol phosphate synthase [Kitasatospora sp. MBT63]